jgi:hypothetical protein
MNSRLACVAGVALAALVLTGCAVEEATVAESPAEGVNAPTTPAEPPTVNTGAEASEGGGTTTFGQTVTWEGVELTVSPPQPYTPTEFAAGHTQASAVVFDVRLVNTGTEPLDAAAYFATVQSGNVEGSEIFDEGIEGSPMTSLLPGREAVWRQAFSVADPADIVMEVEVNWGDFLAEPAIYTL